MVSLGGYGSVDNAGYRQAGPERVERYAADSITEGKDLYAVIINAVTATS